ncbi:MAG: beta-lactamase-like protein [uncultured bacterium]|nr:MAG: beta-lactamase-like protein [uncultured bacterium]
MGDSMEKNWFKVKKIFPKVWGLAEFNHFEKVVSYLFIGDKKALLFDTGLGIGNLRKEISNLTDFPIIVVNSHSHYDHVGGNQLFKRIKKNIKNRETISISPFEFIVIKTPGHTPDSICLLETSMRLLLSGDTMYPGPIYLHLKESSYSAYRQSIRNLNRLDNVRYILPGHNAFLCKGNLIEKIFNKISDEKVDHHDIKINKTTKLKLVS